MLKSTLWRIGLVMVLLFPATSLLPSSAEAQPPGFNIPSHRVPAPRIPRTSPPSSFAPTYEWSCSGCGTVIGRGMIKPHAARCPRCDARFNNTMEGMLERHRDIVDQQNREFQRTKDRLDSRSSRWRKKARTDSSEDKMVSAAKAFKSIVSLMGAATFLAGIAIAAFWFVQNKNNPKGRGGRSSGKGKTQTRGGWEFRNDFDAYARKSGRKRSRFD